MWFVKKQKEHQLKNKLTRTEETETFFNKKDQGTAQKLIEAKRNNSLILSLGFSGFIVF